MLVPWIPLSMKLAIIDIMTNDITAKVDPSSGKITEYRVGVKIAFGVQHS